MNDELVQRAANEETSYVSLNSRKRRPLMKLYILLSLIPIIISVTLFFVIRSELSNQQSSLTLLQTENSALNTSLTTLQSQNKILETSLEALQTENSALNTSLITMQSQNMVLQTLMETLQTANSALNASITPLQSQTKVLQTSMETLQTENSALQSSLTAMNTSLQDQVSILQNQTILIPFSVNSTESIQFQCSQNSSQTQVFWTYETPILSDNGGNLYCTLHNWTANVNGSTSGNVSLNFRFLVNEIVLYENLYITLGAVAIVSGLNPGANIVKVDMTYACNGAPLSSVIVDNYMASVFCTLVH